MKRVLYSERDYSFGQTMLALRTAIGLTQMGLADHLGISRRAVGEWEAGSSYPKADNLKQLIALAIEQRAFPAGSEAEQARELWKATRQKVSFDEQWFSALLSQRRVTFPCIVPQQNEETSFSEPATVQPIVGPRVDWGDALAVPIFYGREQEITQLTGWILQERCRVVSLLGMGGIGKSALAVKVMHELAGHFEIVIFRSLRDAPPCEELLEDCLQVLSPLSQQSPDSKASIERRISLLLEHLRSMRVLLVLDNLESLLVEGNVRGHLRPGFEGYGRLLRQAAETTHQSCLLLTSREKLAELRPMEGKHAPVRSLRLAGLDALTCEQLLIERDIIGTPQEQARITEVYAGNPLALKIVAETINDLFGGEISQFLSENLIIFGSITELLGEQFARLSSLEQTVLCWLAIMREPVTIDELMETLVTPLPRSQVLEAVDGLRHRCLIERGQRLGSFTLQSVVQEYITIVLIKEATREIQQGDLDFLIQYGMEQAYAREYVRQTQERLLLAPIVASLRSMYRGRAAVEELLLSHLDQLHEQAEYAQGYGPANLIALLRLHQGHLRGINLSHLVIRGAYLQGIEMQDTSLVGAIMRDTVFTEALDAIGAVDISHDGTLWAAGSFRGEVRVWDEGGQTLRLIWQAHSDLVAILEFSPDGHTLASVSLDGTVKLWDLQSGALIWTGRQDSAQYLAFSPDGSLLASGGLDATIQIWDVQSGTNLQTLPHPGHVHVIIWSPDGHLLASGDSEGNILLWETPQTSPTICVEMRSVHSGLVTGLAFAPDGRTLASASWDHTVKLWEVASGRLLQTLSGHTDKVFRVAWSPDVHTLASCGFDDTIWLWDVEQGRYRAALHGHTADVYNIAFTPDSNRLLSGGADGTLRVWDVASGQCVYIIQGYSVSLYDLDWHPDGTQIACGDTNTEVTIWDVSGGTPPRVLCGHSWNVAGVTWSPDGRLLASSGWDDTICLWNATSGNCVQRFHDPATIFQGIAWQPDGHLLACGTYQQGVRVWDMDKCRLCWAWRKRQTVFHHIAWSPDGTQVASGGDDGIIYVWKGEDGTLLRQLSGHHGMVASVVWSPDGTRLLSGGGRDSGEMFVWDAQRWELMQTFAQSADIIYAVVWAPSGDILVSGDSNGILRWWDAHNGQCIKTQTAHRGTIQSLKISPDGSRLASCGVDGAIMIWDLHNTEHLQTLRRDRPYERLDITGIRGLTEARKSTLRALGAIETGTASL